MLSALISALVLGAPQVNVSVDATKIGIAVSPDLYGIFFEEINCAGDGGIYPEQIRNRSFEDSDKLVDWKVVSGQAPVVHSGRLMLPAGTVISNPGFYGIALNRGDSYQFSVRYSAKTATTCKISLREGESVMASTLTLPVAENGFKKIKLKPSFFASKGSIELSADHPLELDSPKRSTPGPDEVAHRTAPRLYAISRRLLGRGRHDGDGTSLENHDQ
jgi:hypothetical protein